MGKRYSKPINRQSGKQWRQDWMTRRKRALLRKTNGVCYYCRKPLNMQTVTFDHVRPQSRGGRWNDENLMPACKPCNSRKGSLSESRFRRLFNMRLSEDDG